MGYNIRLGSYILASIASKSFPDAKARRRKILSLLLLIEDYMDEKTLDASCDGDGDPDKLRLIFSRKMAVTKYPLCLKDFYSENIRILYWLWKYYFGKVERV